MNKTLQASLGVLLVLTGLIWTLQGLGYLPGKLMSGVTIWAIIGPVVAVVGVLLVAGAARARQ